MTRCAALALVAVLSGWPGAVAAQQQHDNVLVVVADDVGVDRVAVYRESLDAGPTPVIDGLAARGVLFRHAYANPVCSPTRMAILTGRDGFRTGVGTGLSWGTGLGHGEFSPGPREVYLAEQLARSGYRTGAVGKWHLVTPEWKPDPYMQPVLVGGFDVHLGSMANLPLDDGGFFHWTKNLATKAGAVQLEVDHYATSDNVDDALRLIGQWGDRPWFLWLAFNAPHAPWHVPPAALHTLPVDESSPDALLYRADLEALDTELGRLLSSLPADVRERTTVIFLGDNGTPEQVLPAPDKAGGDKGTAYEGGIRVPLIVSGARVVQPGREVWALVDVVDLFDTVLELARAPDPATGIDSMSLVPYLADPAAEPLRRWSFSEKFMPNGFEPPTEFQIGIRDERFKLVRRHYTVVGPGGPRGFDIDELYDLLADAHETDDLLQPQPPSPEAAVAYADLEEQLAVLLATGP